MASINKLLCRKNGNEDDKSRVYFTCHPDDFELYFNRICSDILKAFDCAIYYAEDMSADIGDFNDFFGDKRINLFVVPVTEKLLNCANRAMNSDIKYAKENNIPVLPFMMEQGIDEIYANTENFGTIQYLNPDSADYTEISYEKKLSDFLDSLLLSKERFEQIRREFDAHIFLSYRKKDRKHANKLLKMIHENPECAGIAVWFDEFLNPSEDFTRNIDKMLEDSKLFLLLVTPNLLEYPEGKPNYVMEKEYPDAVKAGKSILPVEMVTTDRAELIKAYEGIPEPVDAENSEELYSRLIEPLIRIARENNNTSPDHEYNLGLAYIYGVDVECNMERGVQMLKSAADKGSELAMMKLHYLYKNGQCVSIDNQESLKWLEKFNEYTVSNEEIELLSATSAGMFRAFAACGEDPNLLEQEKEKLSESETTLWEGHLSAKIDLAESYIKNKRYAEGVKIAEETYALHVERLGKAHKQTLMSMRTLAYAYRESGNLTESLRLFKETYELSLETYGEDDIDTLVVASELADTYSCAGMHEEAMSLYKCAFAKMCEKKGEYSDIALTLQHDYASVCSKSGDCSQAFELAKDLFYKRRKQLGDSDSKTESALYMIRSLLRSPELSTEAVRFYSELVSYNCQAYGENSRKTIDSLKELIDAYDRIEDYQEAIRFTQFLVNIYNSVYGFADTSKGDYPYVGEALQKMFDISVKWYKKVKKNYRKAVSKHGKRSLQAEETLRNLIEYYMYLECYAKSLQLSKKLYSLQVKLFGATHPNTLLTLSRMETMCNSEENKRTAAKYTVFINREKEKNNNS